MEEESHNLNNENLLIRERKSFFFFSSSRLEKQINFSCNREMRFCRHRINLLSKLHAIEAFFKNTQIDFNYGIWLNNL